MALADAQLVRLDLFHQPELFQLRHHLLARLDSDPGRRTCPAAAVILASLVDHLDARQVVALARFEIVGIVRGRDLHRARAELRIGHLVENDRNLAIHQRQLHRLAGAARAARGSFGLIATAVSPSIVSGRVVATTSFIDCHSTG